MEMNELDGPCEALFEFEEVHSENLVFIKWLKNNHARYSDKSNVAEYIEKLLARLSQNEAAAQGERTPYYNLFIAYAYAWNNQLLLAEIRARLAELEFLGQRKYLQAAISGWFLGLLWCKNGKPDLAQEKINALQSNIVRWDRETWEFGQYGSVFNDLQKKIHASSQWMREHGDELEPEPLPEPVNAAGKNKAWAANPPTTATTWEHNHKGPAAVVNQINPKPYIIPAYPLYGPVAAGPGQPYLRPTGEILPALYDENCLEIHGKDHSVTLFVKQIDENGTRKCGWLQVVGSSMNAASGTPIQHADYVLFLQILDARQHIDRIVIGEVNDHETQPPQLVIKRLIKKDDKFFLHSESSLDEDPASGLKYKDDIEIVRNNQVVGVVIAIAKPLPEPSTVC